LEPSNIAGSCRMTTYEDVKKSVAVFRRRFGL
jgi:hypothetical protein